MFCYRLTPVIWHTQLHMEVIPVSHSRECTGTTLGERRTCPNFSDVVSYDVSRSLLAHRSYLPRNRVVAATEGFIYARVTVQFACMCQHLVRAPILSCVRCGFLDQWPAPDVRCTVCVRLSDGRHRLELRFTRWVRLAS